MFKTFIDFCTGKGISEEQFNTKSDAEKLALQKEYTEDLRKSFNTTVEGMAPKTELTALKAKVDAIVVPTDHEAVKALAQKLETEIEALKEKQKPVKKTIFRSFGEMLKAAFSENAESLKAAASDRQTEAFYMEVKAAVTIGLDNTVEATGSESQVSVTRNSGIISAIRKRVTQYLGSGVSVGSLAGDNKIMWIEELDEQGDPIFIGEGDDKTQISVRYEEREAKARKIAVHGKVTTEMMRNLPSLINYIQNNMTRRVDISTENGLFSGDGTGDSLNGLEDYATAFTGGGLTTPAPTYADVFRALALQVELAHGVATTVFVRPAILAEMDVEKTSDGHYLLPPFKSANGTDVAGITLKSSTAINSIASVDFIGGDMSVANVLFSDTLSIRIGEAGNDFTKNLKTIVVEQELVQFVSANDTQVLVKGDMDAAIIAITAA